MVQKVITEAKGKMDRAMETLKMELSKMRTGRASTSILDDVRVEYYGQNVPLNQVSTLGVPDARLITIQPWEAGMVSVIEKAILKSGLGLNPNHDGKVIKLPIPPLNEERRKELVKYIKKLGEDSKVSIRNIRRDANEHIKKLEKSEHASEDDIKKGEKEIQKLTDDHIKLIDDTVTHKEKEIMTI
ncbi:MAG: ribosome recycling factor [Deltaproteobacteria bacterium CG11_big_fil_rev_8_21_14_0_20_49_13]|nr:MAG: ribosome recycling factor [Deltaproteobacteria bacterium CG11_big_fil_rev_8_21_14_0_20_49_13]